MHLVVPFAAPLSEAGRQALTRVPLPLLDKLVAGDHAPLPDEGDESSLSPPHERVIARALGLEQVADGLVPLAAWRARQLGLERDQEGGGWARVTPVHWNLATEQVSLLDPAMLNLDEAQSRTAFDALHALFAGEGFELHWVSPTEWLCRHESLALLPTASLDRAIGRSVGTWLLPHPDARRVRRLQNEAQMLLHRHDLNAEREARGELAVNSIWFSGSGRLSGPAQAQDLQVDDRLRRPALNEDWVAWGAAFEALQDELSSGLPQRLREGETVRLTLCGERGACTWTLMPRKGLAGLARGLVGRWQAAPDVRHVLERL
jgi:hypothetical protein